MIALTLALTLALTRAFILIAIPILILVLILASTLLLGAAALGRSRHRVRLVEGRAELGLSELGGGP